MEGSRYFDKPFEDLIKQVREHLESMVVSHKPKNKLGIKIDEKTKKKQLKIRGAIHEETYYGKLNGRDTKTIEISKLSAKDISKIIDQKVLAKEIEIHRKKYETMKEAFTGEGLKIFNDLRIANRKPPVYKVKVWYSNKGKEDSTLQRIYDNNAKQSVITGDNFLFIVMESEGQRVFDIVSLYDSVGIAQNAIKENEEDLKKQIAEEMRISYVERNKIKGKPQKNPSKILFTLQQNEMVYLPTDPDDPVLLLSKSEFEEWIKEKENKKAFCKRIYKVVKFSGKDCNFIPHNYAKTISVAKDLTDEDKENLKQIYGEKKIPKKDLNFVEYGSYRDCSPYEVGEVFVKSLTKEKKSIIKPLKIQNSCIKLQIDWLGNIKIL